MAGRDADGDGAVKPPKFLITKPNHVIEDLNKQRKAKDRKGER
jgi:hypothetical protein